MCGQNSTAINHIEEPNRKYSRSDAEAQRRKSECEEKVEARGEPLTATRRHKRRTQCVGSIVLHCAAAALREYSRPWRQRRRQPPKARCKTKMDPRLRAPTRGRRRFEISHSSSLRALRRRENFLVAAGSRLRVQHRYFVRVSIGLREAFNLTTISARLGISARM